MNEIKIEPKIEVCGNMVEVTQKGKIQVINSKGHIKTLTKDEFKKNLIKNADKINKGENFEFKKDNKGLKIAAAALLAGAIATGVVYRKEIGKFVKDFSFKKAIKNVKDFYNKLKNKFFSKHVRTVFDNETANVPLISFDKGYAETKKTLQYKKDGQVEWVTKFVKEFEDSAKATKDIRHHNKQKQYDKLFI